MGLEYEEDVVDGSEFTTSVQEEEYIKNSDHGVTNMAAPTDPCVVKSTRHNGIVNGCHHIPDMVTQIAKDLAFDTIHHISKAKKNRKPSNKHAVTLRRTVEEMSMKHEILFNGMVKKLQIDQENAFIIFTNVANEIFKDKQYNWGRVVSLYAFGARMARHVIETDRTNIKLVDKIADIVGKFVAESLGKWIHEQGGWVSFILYIQEP